MNQSATKISKLYSNKRAIIIDGCNIARTHGDQLGGKIFSCAGIKIVVDHFLKLGHTDVVALLPSFRRGTSDRKCPTLEPELLDEMRKNNNLVYTPSRKIEGKVIIPYDDRLIIETAVHYNAIIVSNDNYRDLMEEDEEWKKFIEENLLQYSFVGDLFLIPSDPMGRNGPKLQDMLADKPKITKATTSINAATKSKELPTKESDKNDKIFDNIKATTNAYKLSKAQKANSSSLASKNHTPNYKDKLPTKELDENDKRVENSKASAIDSTKLSNNKQSSKLLTKVSDTKGRKTVEDDSPPVTNTKGKANSRKKTQDSNDKKISIS